METGTDGRFYDWHFDDNHDGSFDVGEQLMYDEITFGKDSLNDIGSGRRTTYTQSGNGLAKTAGFCLMACLFIFGILLAVFLPPLGIFLILGGYKLKEML